MNKNRNQPLSLNDIESVKNSRLPSITSVTLNELNDITGGQTTLDSDRVRPPRAPLGNIGGTTEGLEYFLFQLAAWHIASTIGL